MVILKVFLKIINFGISWINKKAQGTTGSKILRKSSTAKELLSALLSLGTILSSGTTPMAVGKMKKGTNIIPKVL